LLGFLGEFNVMDISVRIGTNYHFESGYNHYDDPFPFSDYSLGQLVNLASHNELDLITSPIYGFPIVTSGGEGKLVSNRKVVDQMYCLWKKGGYGFRNTERSMWITKSGDDFDFVQWPWSAESGKETWHGMLPKGTVADAHTHPANKDPKPSQTDQKDATTTNVPFYTITRDAVWEAVPGGKEPVQVLGQNWWKDSEKREKNGELKCP